MSDYSYSYSALSTALRCNRLFQHLFIDKLKTNEPEGLALHFGTALHCGINSLIEGDTSSSYNEYWASVEGLTFAKERHSWEDLAKMGQIFLDRFEKLHLKHFKKHAAEERLYGFLPGGTRVEGTPDYVGEYKGVMSVVDFKTSSSRYHDRKIRASDQLHLYTYLAQKAYNIKALQMVYIVFIKGREPSIQVQSCELDQEALMRRIENIEQHCKELAAKASFPQNFNACFDYNKRCAFFTKCHGEEK